MSGNAVKAAPDWERIEQDFRAGLLSLREIAAQHGGGLSHVAITKRAKRDGWTRDLSAKIRAKADELVNRAEVNSAVNTAKAVNEKAIVDANAEVIARIRRTHRADIARARKQAMKLLDELEHTGEHIDLIEQLERLVALDQLGPDSPKSAFEKRAQLLHKVLELPTRTGVMKALAETMTKLIALEREAYSLETARDQSEGVSATDTFKSWLQQIDGAGTGLPKRALAP